MLMQNPDGTEALMLLVSDLKRAREDLDRKEKAAKALRDRAPPGTYEVCMCMCMCELCCLSASGWSGWLPVSAQHWCILS